MQFLKILFWCLLAFVAAVATIGNWTTVPINLWGGLVADVNLPLLLLVTFLLGFVPTSLYSYAIRWRLRQRLATCERQLAELRMPRPDPVHDGVAPSMPPAPSLVVPATPTVPATPATPVTPTAGLL